MTRKYAWNGLNNLKLQEDKKSKQHGPKWGLPTAKYLHIKYIQGEGMILSFTNIFKG